MNLRKYEDEYVRLTDKDGMIFEGYVSDYVFPEDNVPKEIEALILDMEGYENPVQFNSDEIRRITIIKQKQL